MEGRIVFTMLYSRGDSALSILAADKE